MSGGGKRAERFSPVMALIILAGTLFGYDQGVISGALAGIRKAFHLAITIGIFIAYQVDATLTADNGGWRLMLGVAGIVGVTLFLVMLAAPESPRWLLKVGRRADALSALRAVHPDADQPALPPI